MNGRRSMLAIFLCAVIGAGLLTTSCVIKTNSIAAVRS